MRGAVIGVLAIVTSACSSDRDDDDGNLLEADRDNDSFPDVFDQCPDEPADPTDDDGCPDFFTVEASWTLQTSDGMAAPCPTGFDTIALTNVAVDAAGVPITPNCTVATQSYTCFVDLFNCEPAGRGVSAPLPAGPYQTWLAVTNDTASQVHAQSLTESLNVVSELEVSFSIVVAGD